VSVPVQTSLAGLLAQAEHRVTRRIECALRAADVSSEQWRVLSLLSDGRGHPMTEIASFALVPAPTLTKIIDRLTDRTLVYRRVDSEDRRRVLVFLSSRGADLYHMLGIDVHDMEDLGDRAGYAPGRVRSANAGDRYLRLDRDLRPGMCVTIEPGFYQIPALLSNRLEVGELESALRRERLADFADVRGIRIEDDVLVTTSGCEVLTRAIPKTTQEVEAAVRDR